MGQKYSMEETEKKSVGSGQLDTEMQMKLRLFRAQRNFYIAGFALFFCLVIKRLVGLISADAGLQAETEAAMKQAESASRAAEVFMKDGSKAGGDNGDINEIKAELETAKKEAEDSTKDMLSMKSQSESLAMEYDRLMEEKNRLERKVKVMGDD